jgi:phage shock protein C
MNRRLYRCRENRVIAGVAAGLAEYFGLDPTLVRALWFVSIFFGGVGIVIYLGLAIIVPLEPLPAVAGAETTAGIEGAAASPEGHHHVSRGNSRASMFIGFALILVGALALLDMVLPGISWRQLWPVLLISIGGLLVVGALRRETSDT